jgi:hypothetical protein
MKLACYDEEKLPLSVTSAIIYYYFNFLIKKAKSNRRDQYKVECHPQGAWRNPERFAVTKHNQSGHTTHLLGYDFKEKCWYTDETDNADTFEASLKQLEEIDLPNSSETKINNAQKNIIGYLQTLDFLPPYFAYQLKFPHKFSLTPRDHMKVSEKSLTLFNDQFNVGNFLKSLVENNFGILFLLNHADPVACPFMSSCMKLLAEQGVKHFYEEAPIILIYAFNCFNETGDVAALRDNINKKKIKMTGLDQRLSLYEAAFKNGIKIFPVDRHVNNNLTFTEAVQDRNNIIVRNVEHFNQSLPSKAKYCLLFGKMHYDIAHKNNLNIPSCAAMSVKSQPSFENKIIHNMFFKMLRALPQERQGEWHDDLNLQLWGQLPPGEEQAMYNGIDYTLFLPVTLSDDFLDTKATTAISSDYFKTPQQPKPTKRCPEVSNFIRNTCSLV